MSLKQGTRLRVGNEKWDQSSTTGTLENHYHICLSSDNTKIITLEPQVDLAVV